MPTIPVHIESAETWVAACLLSDESHLMCFNRTGPIDFPKKVENRLQVFETDAKTTLQRLFRSELTCARSSSPGDFRAQPSVASDGEVRAHRCRRLAEF